MVDGIIIVKFFVIVCVNGENFKFDIVNGGIDLEIWFIVEISNKVLDVFVILLSFIGKFLVDSLLLGVGEDVL